MIFAPQEREFSVPVKLQVYDDDEKAIEDEDELFICFFREKGEYRLEATSENHVFNVYRCRLDKTKLPKETTLEQFATDLKQVLDNCSLSKDYFGTFQIHNKVKAVLLLERKVPLKRVLLYQLTFELESQDNVERSVMQRYRIMLREKEKCLARLAKIQQVLQLRNPHLLHLFREGLRGSNKPAKKTKP